jgi:hypothetical protein
MSESSSSSLSEPSTISVNEEKETVRDVNAVNDDDDDVGIELNEDTIQKTLELAALNKTSFI